MRHVFKELNKQYTQLTKIRVNNFLSSIAKPIEEDPMITYTFKLCLLPHQIFIMPKEYFDALELTTRAPYKFYSTEDLMYIFSSFFLLSLLIL